MPGFQTPITIYQAIDRIRKNEYLLPSFQREYVWSAIQVENLFDSLMNDYPISSMLFWKVKGDSKNKYRFYKVLDKYIEKHHIHNDVFDTNQVNDFSAVLDGQQRLTSLYLGLCGSYAYHSPRKSWANSENSFPTRHLYLNITEVSNVESDENRYKFLFKDKSETNQKDIIIDDNDNKWFRVGRIISLRTEDYDIDDFADDNHLTREEKKVVTKLGKVIFDKALINFYEEDTDDPDKAVNIFVRINSGGTKLEFSDILLSIAVASWTKKDARTEIYRLVDDVNSKGFNISHDYILKSFLFLYHNEIKFKIRSFNNGFISLIEEKWDEIRSAISNLFDLLKTFGLDSYRLTSNNATLPILYYLYHRGIYKDFATSVRYKDDRSKIRVWLLKTLLLRSFGQSADGVLANSRKAFSSDFVNIKIDNDILDFPSDKISQSIKQNLDISKELIVELLDIQKDNRYAFAIMSMLYPNLDYKNNNFHLDHLHPATAFSDNDDHEWYVHNSIVNLQMLDANENESKNAMPLEDWVSKETQNGLSRTTFLETHLIPDVDLSYEKFNDFVAERRKLLVKKLYDILK